MIEVKVPGKLFIAGEYAILEPGNKALVIAVNRYMKAELMESDRNRLSFPQMDLNNIRWKEDGQNIIFTPKTRRLAFIRSALQLFNRLLEENGIKKRPFAFTTMSELVDPSGKKYGLGSSGAISVAFMTALLHFYQIPAIPPTKENIYKLAAISHYMTQGNGSCADIAASTYGGWILYSVFQPEWLLREIQKPNVRITDLLKRKWPMLSIQPIRPPQNFPLCIGWTGKTARTGPLVNRVQSLKKTKPNLYHRFLAESKKAVAKIEKGFAVNDLSMIAAGLLQNREALRKVAKHASVKIETPQMAALIKIAEKYGIAKSSGAGGGDCGIALLQKGANPEQLYEDWEKNGITPLKITVSDAGVTVFEYNG